MRIESVSRNTSPRGAGQTAPVYTPSQISGYIKGWMDRDRLLGGLLVRGELSNYKIYPSGHHYFSLKDPEGALRCVMFAREASTLRFRPQNGMQVIASGRVSVFPRDGQYQLYCTRLTPEGAGDLHLAFEQLKQRLMQEGLFALEHKRPKPPYPGRLALVTSPAGAAVRDMLRILKARFPAARVYILPVRVQGEEAAGEIAAALDWANYYRVADLIITGRGGGSMEDLWAFNEEAVARAIYRSSIPVISAVGHEPDVTIADFVADLRAATPSNAAELAVPDRRELLSWVDEARVRCARAMLRELEQRRRELRRMAESRVLRQPESFLGEKQLQLDSLGRRMAAAMQSILARQQQRLGRLSAGLDALSPLKVLGRGYSLARREDGALLTSAGQIAPGERLHLRLREGGLLCRVEQRETAEEGQSEA